jgi:excisionase family DNA binding protein
MEKRLLNVTEAAGILGIGRSVAYVLVMTGELESIKIGRRRKIPVEAIGEFIAKKRDVVRFEKGDWE